jgi:hypothetical protein
MVFFFKHHHQALEQLARMHLWLNDKLLSASEEADILLFKFWLWQVRLHCINAHIRLRNYKAVCLVIFSTGYFCIVSRFVCGTCDQCTTLHASYMMRDFIELCYVVDVTMCALCRS